MKTAGIIGGVGPESTVDYYRSIISAYKARRGDDSSPSLLITSVDVQKLLVLMTAGRLPDVVAYLAPEVERLARGGADFAVISANTPHIVFDELKRGSPIPMISIVEATRDAASERGLSRLLLLGTRFTMEARLYPDVCAVRGIDVVVPDAAERVYVHGIYVDELLQGQFRDATRDALLALIARYAEAGRIDGVVLGGTELPLLLRRADHHGVPFLDTTKIHVDAIVNALLA
jgi:aspartate racemase